MSLPTSLRAYRDCEDLFTAATADPKGARARAGDEGAAYHMRTRLNYFRSLQRDANAEIYPPGHPDHGTSIYDEYTITMIRDEDGFYWLYVEPRTSKMQVVEGLSNVEALIDTDATEVLALEDQSNGKT